MALYSHGLGRYRSEYGKLWDDLVPDEGRAETLQGELVRVIGRLASEYYRNGNMNWESGYDMMLVWLFHTLNDEAVFDSQTTEEIERDVDYIRTNAETGHCPYDDGEDEYDRLTDRVVEWCHHNPHPIPTPTELPYSF